MDRPDQTRKCKLLKPQPRVVDSGTIQYNCRNYSNHAEVKHFTGWLVSTQKCMHQIHLKEEWSILEECIYTEGTLLSMDHRGKLLITVINFFENVTSDLLRYLDQI